MAQLAAGRDLVRPDRAHVTHPITELRKHERSGARTFVGGQSEACASCSR
jgi:hypothetical protein